VESSEVTVTPHEAGGTPQGSLAQVAENFRRLVDARATHQYRRSGTRVSMPGLVYEV
jgi:hypothetical protein